MNKEFVPYKEALALKELGFNEPCFGVYYTKDGDIRKSETKEYGDAPLVQQAFKFLREKFNLIHMLSYDKGEYHFMVRDLNNLETYHGKESLPYETAEIECIRKMIKIVNI